jgi:hypothetical protein
MEAEKASETLAYSSILMWLVTQEDFIKVIKALQKILQF